MGENSEVKEKFPEQCRREEATSNKAMSISDETILKVQPEMVWTQPKSETAWLQKEEKVQQL
jgi:hypothetical protein